MAKNTCMGKMCEICTKKKGAMIIVGLGVVLILGSIIVLRGSNEKDKGVDVIVDKDGNIVSNESVGTKDLSIPYDEKSDSEVMDENIYGNYMIYDEEKIGMTERTILSFSATWCPSCVSFDKNITASKTEIPEGVTVLKVDYDTNKDLRKKYGVRSQHTFVEVDKDGTAVKTVVGSINLKALVRDFTL